jgi:trehalose/maltose transport system substrate-binding protein
MRPRLRGRRATDEALNWYNPPDSDFRLTRVPGLLQAGFVDELPKKAPMKFNIPGPAHRQIDRIRFWPGRFTLAGAIGVLSLLFATSGCQRSSPSAVTLTFIDAEGLHDVSSRKLVMDQALREFTLETGIKVNYLPAPENNRDKLALDRKLLQEGSTTPDVYGIDTIWTGILSDYLIDLKPYFSSELASEDSTLLAEYKSQGKQVAMPYHLNVGVLYYRTDLLHRYGYSAPPGTWDELEKMAVRIQAGERARGEKDFWGFVWPGVADEGLICNALEWQMDEGGGRIVEDDRKISVNNPAAIRAWERAAHWVGWISPPVVISYQQWDTYNAFWVSGKTAFIPGWANFFLNSSPQSPFRDRAGVTSLPGGRSARVGTLGGMGLAVSRFSVHRAEAIKLVSFLTEREAHLQATRVHADPPGDPEIYELPAVLLRNYPRLAGPGAKPAGGEVSRPSSVTGKSYNDVDQAYVRAVHSVLTGESKAPEAAAALEKELVGITGFETTRQ